MNETKATVKPTFELDIFGQNPRLSRLYTQLCFAFSLPVTGGQSQQNVVEHLRQGLRRLSISLPWLAGNVVQDSTGVFKTETSGELPQLIVKDARHELPPFEKYRRAKFPFSMLDEKLIASCNTMPTQDSQDAPVLSLQLTFVEGGVLLVFSGQHNCMDMRGQSVLMSLVAKTCRDESISDEELVNLRGDYSVPIADLEDANAMPEPSQAAKSTHRPSQDVSDAGKSFWAYFNFSSTALSTLKATAESSITIEFVSTDDVLSAFIWQSVTRARLYRLNAAIDQSTFERQVDVRKHLGLSIDYIGNAVHKTSNQETMVQLLEQPLGVIASHLRESLSPDQDLGHKARVAAARLSLSLKNPMHNPAQARTTLPSTVIKMSSWAKEQCSTFDFGGPLGIAEAVRRPAFQAWEGLAYMMPKALNGDIAVALCLRNTDMDRLRCDEVFMQLGQYIG